MAKPKKTELMSPPRTSAISTALVIEWKKKLKLSLVSIAPISAAAVTPSRSARTVRSGRQTTPARIRGKTNLRTGSPHGLHGVDLLGHVHRAELGGDSGTDPSADP